MIVFFENFMTRLNFYDKFQYLIILFKSFKFHLYIYVHFKAFHVFIDEIELSWKHIERILS